MKRYTVGFVLNEDESEVLLIRKKRPDWQKGFLNGLGGQCDPGEDSVVTMIREAFEEANITLYPKRLLEFAKLTHPEKEVYFFVGRLNESAYRQFKTKTDEDVYSISIHDFYHDETLDVLASVKWLFPMGVNFLHQTDKGIPTNYHTFQETDPCKI